MRIACCGLNLRVAEQLADHRQALAGRDGGGGEGVAQVVDTDVLDAGALANDGARAAAGRLDGCRGSSR